MGDRSVDACGLGFLPPSDLMKKTLLTSLAFLALAACTPAVSPVNPDSGDSSTRSYSPSCAGACAAMKDFGCPEGADPNCEPVFQEINDGPAFFREPSGKQLSCSDISKSRSANDVRALGVSCVQP